jgi:hypothetical protein
VKIFNKVTEVYNYQKYNKSVGNWLDNGPLQVAAMLVARYPPGVKVLLAEDPIDTQSDRITETIGSHKISTEIPSEYWPAKACFVRQIWLESGYPTTTIFQVIPISLLPDKTIELWADEPRMTIRLCR